MHVLVVTVVHRPLDARIWRRQIGALLDAGHRVTYAAPWSHFGQQPDSEVEIVDLPRAEGRRRIHAVRAGREVLAARGPTADVVLLHDPDLLVAAAGLDLPAVVWDVHEDTAAALVDRDWMPVWARPVGRVGVRAAERWAERKLHLILAEEGYRDRFRREHPVVPNVPVVPDRIDDRVEDRVIYVGRLSRSRGLYEMIRLGEMLTGEITVEVVGWVEEGDEAALAAADRAGAVRWHGRGFVPNEEALRRVDGALGGLSLIHDEPNHRRSLHTKVLEYLSRGVPVVATALPAPRRVLERHDVGIVVPFGDVAAAARAVRELRSDPDRRLQMGRRAHQAALEHYDWRQHGPRFVQLLEDWAA